MAVKRRASVGVTVPSVKRQCNGVAKAVLSAEALPASCKNLLSGMAAHALGTYEADRHPFEKSVVDMLSTTLAGIEEAKARRLESTESKVSSAEAEKAARESARQRAADQLQATSQTQAEQKARSTDAEAALATAKTALAAASKKHKANAAAYAKQVEKRAGVEAFKVESLVPLRDGVVEKSTSAKILKQVSGFCVDFHLEKAMAAAALDAFKQAPGDRSAFLGTAIAQFEQRVNEIALEIDAEIAKAEAAKQESQQAVDAAQATLEAATTSSTDAANSLKEATTRHQAAQGALKAADAACKHFFADMKKMMDGYDNGKAELAQFRTTVMGAFRELQTLSAPPPAADPEVVSAEVADAPAEVSTA